MGTKREYGIKAETGKCAWMKTRIPVCETKRSNSVPQEGNIWKHHENASSSEAEFTMFEVS